MVRFKDEMHTVIFLSEWDYNWKQKKDEQIYMKLFTYKIYFLIFLFVSERERGTV